MSEGKSAAIVFLLWGTVFLLLCICTVLKLMETNLTWLLQVLDTDMRVYSKSTVIKATVQACLRKSYCFFHRKPRIHVFPSWFHEFAGV